MQAALLVLLMTTGLSTGLDSICDATQDAPCYGALGGPVYLQLMKNTTGYTLQIKYGGDVIFRFRRSKPVFYKQFNTPSVLQRWQFVPDNGTLIINPAERRDSGPYRVDINDESSGATVGVHTIQLIIEAPVSKVDLSISCSAYGERSVSCSSNGDSPQFSWSVNGKRLSENSTNQGTENQTKTDLTSNTTQNTDWDTKNKTALSSSDLRSVILKLPEGTEGNITCSARNNISSSTSSTQLLPSCITTAAPQSTTTTSTSAPTASMTTNTVSMATNKATTSQHCDCECTRRRTVSIISVSPVFISVWLAEIIILTSLLVGGYYLYTRNKTSHTPDELEYQNMMLTQTSMTHRRRRTPEEVQVQ